MRQVHLVAGVNPGLYDRKNKKATRGWLESGAAGNAFAVLEVAVVDSWNDSWLSPWDGLKRSICAYSTLMPERFTMSA